MATFGERHCEYGVTDFVEVFLFVRKQDFSVGTVDIKALCLNHGN